MAIKELVDEHDEHVVYIGDVLAILESNEHRVDSYGHAKDLCEEMVNMLVRVQVPSQAAAIKDYKQETARVTEIFSRIVKKSGDFEKIFIFCLRTLYRLIVEMKSPKHSNAAAIVFNIYDEELIPRAIHLLLTNSPSNDVDCDVKKVISTLCCWLRSSSGYVHLSKCIVDLLEGLRKQYKYDLLLDIANEVIEPLFIALVIPFIRPYVMPVVAYILTSVQNTPDIFHKIVPRVPKVLHAIDQTISTPQNGDAATIENLQKLVDITSALIVHFPSSDNIYYDVERVLEKHNPSYNFQDVLNVNPWHSYLPVPIRDQSMPVGLVNLGNTCYMNSVLQALFMTKQFTNEIMKMNNAMPVFRPIQELLSLMLYSIRPYITPHGVLCTRPPNFRNGYQQDSFEYLGYLLDQLYEEEKKFIINLETRKNQMNNFNNNNTDSNGFTDSEQSPDGTDSATSMSTNLDPDDGSPMAMHTDSMEVDTPTDDSNAAAPLIEDTADENEATCEDVALESAPPSPRMTSSSEIIALPYSPIHKANASPTMPAPAAQPAIVVNNTLIQRTFTGKATITHKCLNCDNESKTVDHFNELQLAFPSQTDYPDETEYTTQQLINNYFATEKLVDDNKYSCETCKTLCDGERNLSIFDGPSNLILVIKHFKYDRKFHIRRKLMHKVHHSETVSLNVTTEEGEPWQYIYRLSAVIVHCGANIDSGHYYTFASDINGNWFKFNDSHISRSSLNELMHSTKLSTPYILFYELVGKDAIDSSEAAAIGESSKLVNGSADSGNYSPISNGTADDMYEFQPPSISSPVNGAIDAPTTTPPPFRHSEPPNIANLSPYLQDYVNQDNHHYKLEMRRNQQMGRSDFYNFHNGNRRSDDRDRDPPSSCGQGSSITTNRYLC